MAQDARAAKWWGLAALAFVAWIVATRLAQDVSRTMSSDLVVVNAAAAPIRDVRLLAIRAAGPEEIARFASLAPGEERRAGYVPGEGFDLTVEWDEPPRAWSAQAIVRVQAGEPGDRDVRIGPDGAVNGVRARPIR